MDLVEEKLLLAKETLELVLADKELLNLVKEASDLCVKQLKQNKKIIFAGNGGSAADSQHLAGELLSRFNFRFASVVKPIKDSETFIFVRERR